MAFGGSPHRRRARCGEGAQGCEGVVAVVAAVSRFLLPRDELALLRGDTLGALG